MYVSLTGAHRGWPTPCCTTPLVGPAAGRVLQQSPVVSRVGGPGRNVVSAVEAAAAGQKNAAAPPDGPQGESPDDPAP